MGSTRHGMRRRCSESSANGRRAAHGKNLYVIGLDPHNPLHLTHLRKLRHSAALAEVCGKPVTGPMAVGMRHAHAWLRPLWCSALAQAARRVVALCEASPRHHLMAPRTIAHHQAAHRPQGAHNSPTRLRALARLLLRRMRPGMRPRAHALRAPRENERPCCPPRRRWG
jgi:hypothetical protein